MDFMFKELQMFRERFKFVLANIEALKEKDTSKGYQKAIDDVLEIIHEAFG